MDKVQKILGLIGLAQKAGKIVSGEDSVVRAVREEKAFLVIVAEDASDNTKKLFKDKCAYRDVPQFSVSTKEILGAAIGKKYRSVIALADKGFADAILKLME